MNGFLLDTNCVSELVRPAPEPKVVDWIEATDEEMLYLSVLTLGEIRKGLTALPLSSKKTRLEHWLNFDLPTRFSGRILAIDEPVAHRWGVLAAEAKREGTPLPIVDGLLAATALHHGLAIVSRNTADFRSSRARIINPWNLS